MATNKNRQSFFQRLEKSLVKSKRIRALDKPFTTIGDLVMGKQGTSSLFSQFNSFNIHYGASPANRLNRYREYDIMEIQEPMCGNALDAWAANATLTDALTKHSIIIKAGNDEIKKELENLFFVVMELDVNAYTWIRNALKYGDWFVFLRITENDGVIDYYEASAYEIEIVYGDKSGEQVPLKNIDDIKKIYRWSRNVLMNTNTGFTNTMPAGGKKYEFYPDYKDNFDTNKLNDKHDFQQYETLHFTIPGEKIYKPYGKGILENSRFAWKQYRLMSDAILIYRVVRAPSRLKFKLEVGTLEGKEMQNYAAEQMASLKRTPLLNEEGDINEQYHVMSHLEDYVLPRRNGFGSDIEELPGASNTDAISDVELFKSNLRASLKVPKAYLEYDESLSTARGLAMEDARFAANVERVQKIMIKEFYKLAAIHLLALGYDENDLMTVKLSFVPPSTQTEKDKLEILGLKTDLISNLKNNAIGSNSYYLKTIMELSSDEIARIDAEKLQDARREFVINQILSSGNYNDIFPSNSRFSNQEQQQGGDMNAMEMGGGMGGGGGFGGGFGGDSLGGSGLGGGSMGMDSLGGGEPISGGFGDELPNVDDLGGGAEPALGGTESEEQPSTLPGGTEIASVDPLRKSIVSNDMIEKPKNKNSKIESYKTFEETLKKMLNK